MNNPNLGLMLRYHRKAADFSVQQVAEKFKTEYGITLSPKTIYGWENGQNQPSADTLLTLCKMYGITNLVESLGYDGPAELAPLILSPEEREIITKYRSRQYYDEAIRKLLDMER